MDLPFDAPQESSTFAGFADADFDAFAPKKQGSMAYTLERRVVRTKLLALARGLAPRVPSLQDWEMGVSPDAPSVANGRRVEAMWVFFTRTAADRASLRSRLSKTDLADAASLFDLSVEHQHLSFLLLIDHEGVRLEVHLSPRAKVDCLNAATKLGYDEDEKRLRDVLASLQEGATAGFISGLEKTAHVSPETVGRWRNALETPPEPWVVRVDWRREDPVVVTEALTEAMVDPASRLAEVAGHLRWSRDNDFARVAVEEALAKTERRRKKPAPASMAPGSRVMIHSGLFKGREGYFAETDGKGRAKVMVGPVSVSVPESDLEALS